MYSSKTIHYNHLKRFPQDLVLQHLIQQTELPAYVSTENVFQDLMSCIIEQQIHYRSSKNIFNHLLLESGLDELHPHNFILLEPLLAKLRLSEAKYKAIALTLDFFSRHNFQWNDLSDKDIRQELTAIQGVGSWTADMILLYTLRRANVFPKGDYHLTKIMIKVYGLDPRKELNKNMLQIAEKWGNNRSLAVLYLLAYKDQLLKKPKK
jgi:DNA-3-methyladenine glycosylase II